jgi:hypothetical protein
VSFLPEDGTGLVASNSYASYAQALAYWADRGLTVAALQPAVEAALVRATDYLGIRYRWRGERLTTAQALDWPRTGVYTTEDMEIDGLPPELVKATVEYARRALAGDLAPDPTVSATGSVVVSTKRKVGPIETEDAYSDAGSVVATWRPYPAVDRLLRHLIYPEGGSVYRA